MFYFQGDVNVIGIHNALVIFLFHSSRRSMYIDTEGQIRQSNIERLTFGMQKDGKHYCSLITAAEGWAHYRSAEAAPAQ